MVINLALLILSRKQLMIFGFHFHSTCAPSTSFYLKIIVETTIIKSLESAGFLCYDCVHEGVSGAGCYNCSFCATGYYSDRQGSCVSCQAGIYTNLSVLGRPHFLNTNLPYNAFWKGYKSILYGFPYEYGSILGC